MDFVRICDSPPSGARVPSRNLAEVIVIEPPKSLETVQPAPGPSVGEPRSPAATEGEHADRGKEFVAWLGRTVPMILVLSALGTVAYWGHHTGWSLRPASPTTSSSAGDGESWVDPGPPRLLHFASAEAVDRLGVEIGGAWRTDVTEAVDANGEVAYDQTRLAHLSSRLAGSVWRVEKHVGESVRAGEVLALVDAVEVGKTKSDFLHALVQVGLKEKTLSGLRSSAGAIPERSVQEADAALHEARIQLLTAQQALVNLGLPVQADMLRGLTADQVAQRIRFLGLPEDLARTLDPRTAPANLLPLMAPLAGTVVERHVVEGEVVNSSKVLFVIADVNHVWLYLNVRAEDARRLKVGQDVYFRPDGSKEDVVGRLTWISTAVDERTRTVDARAELVNPAGKDRLRASTFGTGRIILRREKGALVVPPESVQQVDADFVVFVRDKNYMKADAPKVFHVRPVRLGVRNELFAEVFSGVLPGEFVAAKGSGALRNELLKNDHGKNSIDH